MLVDDALRAAGVVRAFEGPIVDVGSGGKGLLARPREYDHPSRRVRVEFLQCPDQFLLQHHRHRVQFFGAVQGDESRRILRADENRLELHGDGPGKATGRLEPSLPC